MAKKLTIDQAYERHFKREVLDGGGRYVGIQEVEGDADDLVLFNSNKTGSTLALKTGACTSEAVATKLGLHEDKWEYSCTQRS